MNYGSIAAWDAFGAPLTEEERYRRALEETDRMLRDLGHAPDDGSEVQPVE